MRACEACGGSLEGKRKDARTCSVRCKERLMKRQQRGTVVELPKPSEAVDTDPPLVAGLLRELEAADRVDTADGQQALFLARRLASSTGDTAASIASLSKEYRAARAEALKGAQGVRSALDELRARRDAKRGA